MWVTNAQCEGAAEVLPYVAVNLANVLFIEELVPVPADTGAGATHGQDHRETVRLSQSSSFRTSGALPVQSPC